MGPADVSNTSTLYDQGLQVHDITATGTQTITSRPTRLMGFLLHNHIISSSVIIYNGQDTGGEVVADIATSSQFHLIKKSRDFDVVLSGGLTINVINGPPRGAIKYI